MHTTRNIYLKLLSYKKSERSPNKTVRQETNFTLDQGFSIWGSCTPRGKQRICQGYALSTGVRVGTGCLTCTVRVRDRESCARCGWERTNHHPTVVDLRQTGVVAFWLCVCMTQVVLCNIAAMYCHDARSP